MLTLEMQGQSLLMDGHVPFDSFSIRVMDPVPAISSGLSPISSFWYPNMAFQRGEKCTTLAENSSPTGHRWSREPPSA